jgi:hypothetical protein
MSRIVSVIVTVKENQTHQFFQNQKTGSLLKRSNSNKNEGDFSCCCCFVVFAMSEIGKNDKGIPVPARIIFVRLLICPVLDKISFSGCPEAHLADPDGQC